jgi:subtilisin family serine protease
MVRITPYLLLFLLSFYGLSYAQKAITGATLQLLLAEKYPVSPFITNINGEQDISLLIETHGPLERADFNKTGINIRSVFGNIATADVPFEKIAFLQNMPGVKRIELPLLLQKQDTTMKRMTMVDKVHAGLAPLPKAFTGESCMIGVIDDGIDFTHPDFNDSSGKSRVLSIWNMDRKGTPPAGFDYGTEIKYDSIEYYRMNLRADAVDTYSRERLLGYSRHGTPVAGLAAGKNGVAPGALISGVALTAFTDTLLRSDRMLDAVVYLYQKAQQIKRKCIINISLGTAWGGPHDGKTLVEKAIDNFAFGKPDLLIVSSAGNEGNNFKHWGGFPIHRDSSFNFFQAVYNGQIYVSIPRSQSMGVSISLTDSRIRNLNNKTISRDSILGQTPFFNIGQLIDSNIIGTADTKLSNGNPSTSFRFAASHSNENYDELIIDLREYTSTNDQLDWHLYRLIFKGEGTIVHVYYPFINFAPAFHFGPNPLPNDSTFKLSDNEFTTIIPTHAFSVLTAGAYNLRQCYVNMQNKIVNGYQPCQLTYFTSRGPTFDGRIKPDVLAPGENVIAPGRRFETYFGHEYFLDSSKIMFGGTSASSPIIAGMAALLWEQYKNESPDEIKQRLKNNTYSDSWSTVDGALPNNRAGWGKADAFKASTGISTFSDTLCKPVYCRVNTNPVDTLPPPPVIQSEAFFQIVSNPAGNSLRLVYRSFQQENYVVFDLLGRQVAKGTLSAANSAWIINIPIGYLAPGSYFFKAGSYKTLKFLKL